MNIESERKLWRWLGVAATVVAVALFAECQWLYYNLADMTRWPLRFGIAGAFSLLSAISFLVTSRILGALQGRAEGSRGTAWKIFALGSIPVGILVIGVEAWRVISMVPRHLTSNHKAVFAAGAFSIVAGLVGIIGERCVAHIAVRGEKARAVGT